MCGIAGGEKVKQITEDLSHRGSSSRTGSGGFELGHCLHSVVGHVEQPIED